jgi:thioredoxin-like negative regulator of GroEL
MGLAQFRTTDKDEKIIAERMILAGETNRSAHFKRVYFGADQQAESAIGEVRAELRELAKSVDDIRNLVTRVAENAGGDVEQRMLAALFLMIFRSVDSGIQSEISNHMDKAAIEKFLQGTSRRVR